MQMSVNKFLGDFSELRLRLGSIEAIVWEECGKQ